MARGPAFRSLRLSELRLALAWLNREVSTADVARMADIQITNVAAWCGRRLLEAYRAGRLSVDTRAEA